METTMTTTSLPIRVVIADDHPVVRNGIKYSLQAFDDIELVGEAEDGAQALRLCCELLPDVVLMDLKMPEMDGIASTRAIHARYPQVRVLALTSFCKGEMVQQALQAGAVADGGPSDFSTAWGVK